jgi:putative aminopeptidase FrvX
MFGLVNPLELLQEFVAAPGPPGQEDAVRDIVAKRVQELGFEHRTDARGNLLVPLGEKPRILVTAHLDEIAMLVRQIEPDGRIIVGALGGLFPWKLGEGAVQILANEPITGVLSFGSIHTEDPRSTVRKADKSAIDWSMTRVITGLPAEELAARGVRPGTRVVVHPNRRNLDQMEDLVAGYFLDDRADLVAWILALEELKGFKGDVLFAATAAEEVGGLGALWQMLQSPPEICIALELGPAVPDAPVELTPQPTVWVNDGYSAMQAADIDLVAEVGMRLDLDLQFQALSRGGSDASCAASRGFCARPFTLGLAMENSHGYEIMHVGAMEQLGRLTAELVRTLA